MSCERRQVLRALVADDNTFVRAMTARVLKRAGIETVIHAADGREAIAGISRADPPIDVVFCDLMMPDMDGVEVVRHAACLAHKPAFVFISGANPALLTTAVDVARARGFPVLGAIEKPVSFEAVRTVLTTFAGAPFIPFPARQLALSAADLDTALSRDQLILHYQPKVSVRTGEIEGFEALVRWQHPTHGLIPPGQFIPLAEDSGAISAVTDRVLLLALRQCADWNRSGLVTKLSINISAHLLVDLSMPDRIARDAWQHGIKPKQIVLEITESGAFCNAADTLDILARLHMKGFALSIDDFGTGYSSTEQLRRVPFAELKIDRSFVYGAVQNAKARTILMSSADLGKSLGMTVVAEGAESQEEWDLLAIAGVDSVQGYFVARPMPADEVPEWSRRWMAQMGGDVQVQIE